MHADVAMEVLGLSGEPTAAEVRRAYLRQVKVHPPERDPDGFRRVREAYERLQAGVAESPPPVVESPPPVAESPPPVAESPPPVAERPPPVAEPPPLVAESPPLGTEPLASSLSQLVHEQLNLLKRALADGNSLVAADSMVWLYTRPLVESVPVPAPLLALQTTLALMERGRFKRAGELLKTMEDYLERSPQPGGLSTEVAARWKLVTELLATSELDSHLARALAGGLRSGQMASSASGPANAAFDEYGPELERHMREKAPSLWMQVAPLLSAPAYEVRDAPPLRSGFKIGGWPASLVLLVLVNFIRCLAASDPPSRPLVDYSVPARPQSVPVLRSAAPAEDASAAKAPLSPAEVSIRGWGLLQESVRIGDCQTVREQWRPYLALGAHAHSNREVEASRKRQILEMCPELQELLEEPP